MYSHKLLQLLPLHAGGELALLICVEAITMPFVSLGSSSDVGSQFVASMLAAAKRTRPLCVVYQENKQSFEENWLLIEWMSGVK